MDWRGAFGGGFPSPSQMFTRATENVLLIGFFSLLRLAGWPRVSCDGKKCQCGPVFFSLLGAPSKLRRKKCRNVVPSNLVFQFTRNLKLFFTLPGFLPSKFLTIASPLHNAFLRCLQPRGAIVLDPVPACDKLGSSRIDDRHELLPGDRRSPSTTVLTIGGERHLLGPAPVLSRLSCFIAMSSYGGDALIAFLCTQLDGPARPSGAWRKKTCLRCLRYQRLHALLRVPVTHTC